MEQRINIAELLKDCPGGMELNCTMFEGLEFDSIVDNVFLPIRCRIKNSKGGYNVHNFTEYGQWDSLPYAKCVIFPKGKTTWEGFQRPFKDGDILTNERGSVFIYKGPMYYHKELADFYCGYRISDQAFVPKLSKNRHFGNIAECSFASEKEKLKLFDVIKANGYKWNAKTKILEKLIVPKFKVGDKIRWKENHNYIYTINGIREEENKYDCGVTFVLRFSEQDNWELIPNKFDITTLKPFDKVLVRDDNSCVWKCNFYSYYSQYPHNYKYMCVDTSYKQCIPYEDNEHLIGTTNDCDEYFKTWE